MYGGAPKWDQVNKYRQGVHSIIACPGRLNDLLDGRQVQVPWLELLFPWVDMWFLIALDMMHLRWCGEANSKSIPGAWK